MGGKENIDREKLGTVAIFISSEQNELLKDGSRKKKKKKRVSTTINRKRGNPQPVSRPLTAKPLQSLAQRPLEVIRGIGAGLGAES